MPYKVAWEPPAGVVLKLSGVVSSHDFVAGVREVHGDMRYVDLRYVIDDLSEIERFEVDATTIENVFTASVGAGMANESRKIYVVTTDPQVLSQLRQMTGIYDDILPISVYSTIEAAQAARDNDLRDFQPRFPQGRHPR